MVKTLQNIDPKVSQDQLEDALLKAFEELQNEFIEPLPEDKTERYKRQETMITQAFEKSMFAGLGKSLKILFERILTKSNPI